MIYSLLIQCSASQSITLSALKFARALLEAKHSIHRIFFYGDGVHIANFNTAQPQDEQDVYKDWRTFIEENELDAVVCIAAALKRGVLNIEEAQRYERKPVTGAPYDLSGLGQLIEACAHSDRMITFA